MASIRKRSWTQGGKAGEAWEVSWSEQGKQRKKSGFKTKRQADAWAIEKEKALLDGTSRLKEKLLVRDAAKEFVEHTETRVTHDFITAGHARTIKAHINNYICQQPGWQHESLSDNAACFARQFSGQIGHLTLAQAKPSEIERFRDKLLATGMNYKTVKAVLVTLQSLFKYCVLRDYLATNPVLGVKVEVPRHKRSERVTPPSEESLTAVLEAAKGEFRFKIEFAAMTGLRSGEQRAIRYRDVDRLNRLIHVRASVDFRQKEQPPKSEAGVRSIPLTEELERKLSAHREKARFAAESDLIFPSRRGSFLHDHVLLRALNRLFDKLGWPKKEKRNVQGGDGRFVWHGLRHFAISSWISDGLDLKAVQTFAGHADVSTTWNRYGHLFPKKAHWDSIQKAHERFRTPSDELPESP